jgi:hypothetical protein
MNRFVAAMACAVTVAVAYPAGAAAQAAKAAPAAVSPAPAAVSPAPAPTPAASKAGAHAKRQTWTRADARVCLEFPTNLQIIHCAEKYRYTRLPI